MPPKKPKTANAARSRTEKVNGHSDPLKLLPKVLAMLALAALSSPVSQLNLSPVYGAIPSYLYHQKAITATAFIAFMGRSTLNRYLPKNVETYIPVLAFWIPNIQYVLFKFSGQLGPTYGPVLTEVLTFLPLLGLVFYTVSSMLDSLDLTELNPVIADMLPPVGSYFVFSIVEKTVSSSISQWMGSTDLLTRSGLNFLIAAGFAALSPSLLLLLAVPALYHTIAFNPHQFPDRTIPTLNSALQPHNFTLLARHESLTGYVSVLESTSSHFRVLRCDHSLLGGEWLVTPQRQKQGQRVPESIYQVFTMLEGVRLLETRDDKPDSEKSALVIGLGVGTAPKALVERGINTTVVELDPVVHQYAMSYFGLSANHTAAIEDAVPFVERTSAKTPGAYDMIIHDVFTGGAEPPGLFTIEFLEGLKTLLSEKGAIAINYAGDLALPSTQLVLNTINTVFPSCRLFRDSPSNPAMPTDFINMVLYCVKNDGGNGKKAVQFRKPTEEDFGKSLAKKQHLVPKPDLEIDFAFDPEEKKDLLRKGNTHELERYHADSARNHWKIMRTVLPDAVWENW
ncbi:hypothetical protein H2201_003711 [Coniosporium apollinis]|uniref:PABS domain-containing protein n=2 Tax=Coniosporium TaxID=2810619 RepID=A0ABQ9NYZ0_9PEZI|nr:hypothetical protein H2199_002747 [Cladosporium sp. JES 115]KAJ9666276.1 hypothetical protein H2201_003711 [Coniosporium apollinis]